MGRLPRIACDVVLAVLATVCAIFLRTDLDIQWPDLAASMPYLCVTAVTATLVVGASGLDLGFWRFASLIDIVKVIGVALVTTILTVAVVFAYNRLEGVARAIPVMQPGLITLFLLAPRLVARARFTMRSRNPRPIAAATPVAPVENVLVVGLNSMTEVFLRALLEAGDRQVNVAGILCTRSRHVGRFLRQYRALGTHDEVERVVADLAVHGVDIHRLILTVPLATLTNQTRDTLARLEAEQGIRIDSLAQRLAGTRTEPARPFAAVAPGEAEASPGRPAPIGGLAVLRPADLERMAQAPYWRGKRAIDLAVTMGAALVFLPVGILALVLVTIDVGLTPIFWQERLGLGGASFRLYKLRTMGPAHDHRGSRIPEGERLSAIGRFLRRSRLDELPQLWNVFVGDMSLTGPRPLLPIDQPREGIDRLVVRPGLTGWAQIQGGRTIDPEAKAALDIWWIRNASVGLDLRIVAGTLRMAFLGERVNDRAVAEAQAGLRGSARPVPWS